MQLKMRYGRAGRAVRFPQNQTSVLRMKPSEPLKDPLAAVEHALANPIEAAPLAETARGRKDACVVISDITRPVPNRLILPPILRTLEEAGIPRDRILILIATGIHRPNEGEELIELVGEEIAAAYRVENHDGLNLESHRRLGETLDSAPVLIDERFCAADLKITTALIEPHLMAGYSGGRKAVCPGLASIETMKTMHGPELLSHPKAAPGILDGNPFHEEALRIARLAGVDFSLNTALDEKRRLVGVFAGEMDAAHRQGCAFAAERAAVETEPADIVVTTSAGYPLDQTFYQAVKGPAGALEAVKPGGSILLMAECAEGVGSEPFERLIRGSESLEAFEKRLHHGGHFAIDQWQLQELAKISQKADIYLFSEGIPFDEQGRLFVKPVRTPEDGIEELLERYGRGARLNAIPEGPYVLPVAAEKEADI